MTKKQAYLALALGAVFAVASASPVSAQVENHSSPRLAAVRAAVGVKASVGVGAPHREGMGTTTGMGKTGLGIKPGMGHQNPNMRMTVGKVTAINGNSLSINTVVVMRSTTTQAVSTSTLAFTIDATNAAVVKDKATTTVASIAVGDFIIVQGPATGSVVTAKLIMDNGTQGMMRGPGMHGSSTASTSVEVHGSAVVEKPGFFKRIGNWFMSWFR